jgi:hypothetical protein
LENPNPKLRKSIDGVDDEASQGTVSCKCRFQPFLNGRVGYYLEGGWIEAILSYENNFPSMR